MLTCPDLTANVNVTLKRKQESRGQDVESSRGYVCASEAACIGFVPGSFAPGRAVYIKGYLGID
ncbi:MAG: hypothetical protein ACLUD0_04795 [Eubacterium ramulus]